MNRLSAFWLATLASVLLLLPSARAAEKPELAVAPFGNSAGPSLDAWWTAGGAGKTLDAACAELSKSGKFRVAAPGTATTMAAAAHVDLTKPISKEGAQALGRANPEVRYLVLGSLTSYTVNTVDSNVAIVAALNATMLNLQTGESVWTDEANHHGSVPTPPGGVGAGFFDKMFDRVVRPVIVELAADIEETNN